MPRKRLTLQSIHFPPYGLIFPFDIVEPGLAYGVALARAVNSLFSPIFRVDEEGSDGSGAASVETF